MNAVKFAVVAIAFFWAGASNAQSCKAMTNAQLTQLTEQGVTIRLGGEGQGYAGTLTLRKDGTGEGSATTDAGKTLSIAGMWQIEGDRFCRTWSDLNDGERLCETWCLTSGTSVDVYDGKKKLGVNSW